MSKIKIEIKTDNEAFDKESRNAEVARILRGIANKLDAGIWLTLRDLRDINGNRVGSVNTEP
jgi:hypothetical protein